LMADLEERDPDVAELLALDFGQGKHKKKKG
jgi:hypothetical protein